MTFLQAAAQAVSDYPTLTLTGVGGALLTVAGLTARALVNRVVRAFDKLVDRVEGFQSILASHEREDVRRFGEIDTRATERYESVMDAVTRHSENLMSAVQTHADNVTAPLTAVQLDRAIDKQQHEGQRLAIADVVRRVEGLESRESRAPEKGRKK